MNAENQEAQSGGVEDAKFVYKKIGLIILACVLLLSLANWGDIRLLTNREVEERLSRHYGQEFTVVSSMSVSNADALGLWWAKVFVVSPKNDPEVQFFAFNAVDGEVNNSVPGISNSLRDTYSLDIFRNAFEARAASTEGIEEYISWLSR